MNVVTACNQWYHDFEDSMTDKDEVYESLSWLSKNKGFVSLISLIVTICGSIIVACVVVVSWANNIVDEQQMTNHMLDKRVTMAEAQLDRVRENQLKSNERLNAINNEQIRRTETINDMTEVFEAIKRIEGKLEQ